MNKFKDSIVYISGPITGQKDYEEKFNEVENFLKPICKEIINPVRIIKNYVKEINIHLIKIPWSRLMRVDLIHLCTCNSIIMLPGWSYSKGAKLEYDIAKALDFKIFFVE